MPSTASPLMGARPGDHLPDIGYPARHRLSLLPGLILVCHRFGARFPLSFLLMCFPPIFLASRTSQPWNPSSLDMPSLSLPPSLKSPKSPRPLPGIKACARQFLMPTSKLCRKQAQPDQSHPAHIVWSKPASRNVVLHWPVFSAISASSNAEERFHPAAAA